MTSSAQKSIIKAVCNIQGDSVRRIYGKKKLTINEDSPDPYKRGLAIMKKELGIEDLDVFEHLSEICSEFDTLNSDVEELDKLSIHSVNIFNYILKNMGYLWEDIYPNAYKKLCQRVDRLKGNSIVHTDLRDTTMLN